MASLTQGEVLLILVKRDGRPAEQIAEAMDVDKSYLPKLYKMERLPRKPFERAKAIFPEAEKYFAESAEKMSRVEEPPSIYRTSIEPPADMERLLAENAALREEIAHLSKMLEQEKETNKTLAEAILNMSKRH
ncbi:MAG: hypothetical protein KF734_11450 [Saprospiraceae bacterium]|nr:hypothetical protein [Saprospiraceae bacterium]MCW5924795.1 hypothetical protein [Saprospiraceae bacterium]